MSSRWILRSLAVTALVVALPVVASAQTSRVEGMALQGDYIKDYTGIYTYVSGVSNVGNLIYGELGNLLTNPNSPDITGDFVGDYPVTLDRSVGAVLGNMWDGRLGTWAIHLREETPALGQGDAFSQPGPGFGADPNHNTNESFDIMWGQKMGTTSVGLRLNRSYFRSRDEIPGVTTSLEFDFPSTGGGDPNLARNILGLGGGIGFEMNPNTAVEISALFQSRTFESSVTGGTTEEDDSPTTFMLAGRAWWQWAPNVVVVPVVKFYTFDLSNQITPPAPGTATSFDNTLRGWQAGVAGNWTVGTNDLFVLGVTFAQNKLEQEYDIFGVAAGYNATGPTVPLGDDLDVTETIFPQAFAALETHVNNWLTLRFGANKGAFQSLKVEDVSAGANHEITIDQSPFSMHIGAGVKLGTLQLDAILNDLFPQTLGGFFSQIPGFVSFPKVSATYAF